MNRREVLFGLAAVSLARTVSAAPPTDTVVMVHGLWMTGTESGLLRRRLEGEYGFVTYQYSYRSVSDGLKENVRQLREFIREAPGNTVHVVGHSLGGLLALHTLTEFPEPRPGRIVCLGSPLRGSIAARAVAGIPFGPEILGRTIQEAVLNGGLPEYQGTREVGVIAGTLGMGLGVVIENLPEPNDGTVAVEETRLPGVKDHLELPVTHTGLLVSAEVASQTAFFLRHGEFARV
jgi:pimeloyl-ACP methyl ester carboxylesterase